MNLVPMDRYCRLCLHQHNEEMRDSLEDVDTADKIRTCLPVEVNPSFPRNICPECMKMVQDFHNYYLKVVKNQILLEMYLEKGKKDLLNFLNQYNSCIIDTGKEQNTFEYDDKKAVEISLYYESLTDDIQTDNIKEENIKKEKINNTENHDFSSDDDQIALSEIKKEKLKENDLNTDTNQTKKGNKVIKKTAKTKQTAESETVKDVHKCLICTEFTGTKTDIISHYNTIHSDSKSKLVTHKTSEKYTVEKSDTGALTYKCSKCKRIDIMKRKMVKHVESHDENRPFVCRICGRTYKKAYEIFRHGRAHDGAKQSCRFECGYSSAYPSVLQAHEKRHQSQYKYKCEECGKGFQVLTWYREHKNVHTGAKPFQCNLCPMAFHLNRYLTAHMSTVHPRESNLGRHVCLHCQRPCDNRKALYRHMKEQHGVSQRCLCELCGKTLSDPEQLVLHRRLHLGIRPYRCEHCPKSFAKKYNLTVHSRTHSGAQSHSCPLCRKRYTQGSALRRHRCRALTAQPGDQIPDKGSQLQEK